eukprot:CAMPEP_0201552028 /NCGR_PEP_ID=MMETSP0173_2-20130828/12251_1 /ASSEMBLY_ACC=CAM_ASM_000268 /TAXON_ID=218659 /ORGANISM="Vexillifera sp., Strain DIVA3 564/2" /LENGTH=226 /DNA_ID=CAMNT_0047962419 /DNA_START=96 /DNA_END=776 /DNA_ORIENTATION=+
MQHRTFFGNTTFLHSAKENDDDLFADLVSEIEEELGDEKVEAGQQQKDDEKVSVKTQTKRSRRRYNLSAEQASSRIGRVPGSVTKVRLVADTVRGLNYNEAIAQLHFAPQRAAEAMAKCLRTARHHAEHNLGLDPDRLLVERVTVGKDVVIKGMRWHGRGKMGSRYRRRSKIEVILRQIPKVEGERRLGRFGRLNEEYKDEKRQRKEQGMISAEHNDDRIIEHRPN